MDQTYPSEVNYLEAIKRRLPVCAIIAAVLMTASLVLSLGLPSYYRSRAVILIEQQSIPQELVRSVVTSYADQRIQTISQKVLNNRNLSEIINKYGLYAEKRAKYPMEVVQEDMRKDIKVETISADIVDPRTGAPRPATIAFELSYEYKTPELAQKVANEIVSLFLNENLKERADTANETLDFLNAESERLKNDISELEGRLAAFKETSGESLPEMQALNIELMNNAHRELSDLNARIQSAQEQRVYLESELAQQDPVSTAFTEDGERVLGVTDRLKVSEAQLISLTSNYGANHPDVLRMKKLITSLKSQVEDTDSRSTLIKQRAERSDALAEAMRKYSQDHPDVKRLKREIAELDRLIAAPVPASEPKSARRVERPDNPVFIQLQARLQAADAEIRALNGQASEIRRRIAGYERNLQSAPRVEQEYRALTRDYENAQLKYKETLAKKQEAELAKNMESDQKGERFELIEPPITPEKPSKPNRVAIGMLGALISMVGSIGTGTLLEALDTRLYGRLGVVRITGVPPLAAIPFIENEISRSRRRMSRFLIMMLAILTLIAVAAVVHFMVIPLDVLYYRAIRVYGT